jgi:hypothetical protein
MKSMSSLAFAATAACIAGPICSGPSLAADGPWSEPQDTITALFEPDRYAWQLFVALNWPAIPEQKEPDPNRPFGADGPVVWETWRNAREQAPDTVFRLDGGDPGPWLTGSGPVVAREESQFDRIPIKQQVFLAMRRRETQGGPAPAFDEAVGGGNEVRMNQTTYEFIRQNQLYSVEGQLAQFNSGKVNLSFPPNSKEVKAQWRKIKASDKPRYHWAEVTKADGTKEIWGLTGLHITTKDLPNWFWATFEHIDNKQPGPVDGGPENTGWLTRSQDRFACPTAPHDCEQAPTGLGLQGTKWENYRLRGAQIDFIDTTGAPTILANSQIESPFQRQSSCITCHSLAGIDAQGQANIFAVVSGPPRPDWFRDPLTGERRLMQKDFVFSLDRASRANP